MQAMIAQTAGSQRSGVTYSIMQVLPAIITEVIHLARRGTTPWSYQSLSCRPKRGWLISHLCRRGEEREAHQAATIRKGTVGITGRNNPTIPRSRQMPARACRNQRAGAERPRDSAEASGLIARKHTGPWTGVGAILRGWLYEKY